LRGIALRAFALSLRRWLSWLVAENGSTETPVENSRSIKLTKLRAIVESKDERTDSKRAALENEGKPSNDQPAAKGLIVEDEGWIAFQHAISRLKEALGIDDDDFCIGILRQLEKLTNFNPWAEQWAFNWLLSMLKDARPVNKSHAMLEVLKAVCLLASTKQAEVLLKPVRFDLPADFQLAIHNARYDTSRLDKQKIKVDDLAVRQSGERAFSRLMQTYVLLLQASIDYPNAVEASRHKAPKQGLNGSRQSAPRFTNGSRPPNSNKVKKTNGHTPT
jgi:hypothetical protein